MALLLLMPVIAFAFRQTEEPKSWIRINQLGYTPSGVKVAVWCSKEDIRNNELAIGRCRNKKNCLFRVDAGKAFGAYGPFKQTYRLNFSSFKKPGKYYLQAGRC